MTVNDIIQRPTDMELHDISIGSAGLYPDWWLQESPSSDVDDCGDPLEGWELTVSIYDLYDLDTAQGNPVAPVDTCRITADKVWAAALAIATSAVQHTSRETVRQCQRLVYAGADATDFDQHTADQLLQTVVLGWPHYG